MKKPSTNKSKFITYENLDKIGEIPIYYGFTPEKSPTIVKSDIDAVKDISSSDFIDDESERHEKMALHAEEKVALLRMYQEKNMHTLPQPVMLYFKDSFKGSEAYRYADLEILGTSGPIAEATLIQTARIMLKEEGYKDTMVEINSIGDKESINKFTRELTGYYRKHINEMSASVREMFKKDPFNVLSCQNKECLELNSKAPKALDFLSEGARRHLEEVLEFLEALNIPYIVNNSLLGNRKYCAETIFAITQSEGEGKGSKILAVGMRYSNLAKRINMKKDVQGVGISLMIKTSKKEFRKTLNKVKRPIASFVQLGLESKLLSLKIIESLRQAKVPLYLSLAKDRLGAQVSSVEKYDTPYVIVMGKKEAVEHTAIVRENSSHSQNVVPLEELASYMKKISP